MPKYNKLADDAIQIAKCLILVESIANEDFDIPCKPSDKLRKRISLAIWKEAILTIDGKNE